VIFVSLADPGGDLVDDCLFVGNAPVETLRGEDPEFGFGQVQPGAVFRRVMPFEAFDPSQAMVAATGGLGAENLATQIGWGRRRELNPQPLRL
jgi:hypothetical protein